MIKQNIFIFLFLFYAIISQAQTNQYDKNWMIGYGQFSATPKIDGAQIIFEKDTTLVVPVSKDYFMESSTVCLSDSTGKLLYYSGGCTINNFKHKTMVNGDSIGKGIFETKYCTTLNDSAIPLIQMLFTVPHQGNSNWYYYFSSNLVSIYKQGYPYAPTKLYYSIIDMSKNNGEGEVIVKNHEILADTFATSMMQGVRHKNKKDWWIIMPKSRSNCYFIILIDAKGVAKMTKQCDGFVWSGADTGQAVFSPNRKYYARLGSNNNNLNLFDFDNEKGTLKAKKTLYLTDTMLTSGVAFSPNSRYLYAMCSQRVYQYDVKAEDIEKSKIMVAKLVKSPKSNYKIAFSQSMLGPDGKIYIAGQATHDYLHVIQKPNLQGLECNLEQYSLKLPCYNGYGLPNMPHFKDWEEDTSKIASISDFEEKPIVANVYPNPTEDELSLDLLGYVNQYQNGQMQLYNTQGQNVLSFPLLPDHDEYRFDISTLQNGLYIWNLVLDGKVKKIGKIIKME
jgi:hypothetical protein